MSAEDRAEVFFDTNILLYRINSGDPRQARARTLTDRGGLISVQSLNEFTNVVRRKLKLDWEAVDRQLRALRLLFREVLPVTDAAQRQAVELARRYGFAIYDANIAACAQMAGCAILYSEDMQDGQRIGGLTIRNPFSEAESERE